MDAARSPARRSHRRGWLVLVAAWLAGAPAWGEGGLPSHGPMVGAVATDSATVWARWDVPGTARVRYRATGVADWTEGPEVVVGADTDRTAHFPLPVLKANTSYIYTLDFTDADGLTTRSPPAWFRTPMKLPTSLRFSVLADFMNKERASPALRSAATPRPDFLLVIGDLDHSDPARVPDTQAYYPIEEADTVLANMRRMRRQVRDPARPLGADFVKAFVTSKTSQQLQVPLYYVWDDHDFCMNGADGACPFGDLARQVWREYFVPARDNGFTDPLGCGQTGPWQAFHWGQLASFFLLDTRSHRSEPAGTHLGACQKQWLLDGLAASTATWKFIVSPTTFHAGTKPWDAWGAFPGERAELLAAIEAQDIRNVIVLSGDVHSGGALDDGRNAGLPEASVPHANMPVTWVNTYCRLDPVDKRLLLSTPGTWQLGGLLDPNLQREPVSCLGKDYSTKRKGELPPPPYPLDGTDGAGFLQVEVGPATAVLRVMDASGQLKRGFVADGSPADMQLEFSAR
jgi:alkaline phosphatase D